MSVLTEAYAIPSRVVGVYRFVLHTRGQRESLESLTDHLAPKSLPVRGERVAGGEDSAGKEMVRKSVNECLVAGLLSQDGDDLRLHPDLPREVRDPATGEAALPTALAKLFFAADNDANHDLGLAIAWYLSLDADAPPGTWPEVEKLLLDTGMKETLKLGDVRYHMLEDWLCYLGFGWTHVPSGRKLVPDPTAYIRRLLGCLFPTTLPDRQPLPAVMARLADACPVFEGGYLRSRVDAASDGATRLSRATALAWMRLRDEGAVVLHHESDGQTLMLPDGDQAQPVSHVTVVRWGEV